MSSASSAAQSSASSASSVSSELRNKFSDSGVLLGALDGITRWRPFALLVMTFVACGLISAALGASAAMLFGRSGVFSAIVGLLGTLMVAFTALVGVNGVGILLSDDVWERPPRGIKDALQVSLLTSHRLILILLLEGALFLAYLMVLAVLLFLCKIPAVGPLLYAIIVPIGAILSGVVLFGLVYVAIPLAAPAVWNGASVIGALAMLKEVVRHRLLFVVVLTLLLGLLLVVVGGLIAAVVGGGTSMILGLSATIIGASMDPGAVFSVFSGVGRSGGGYAWALGFGMATLFLFATAPVILVGMKGAALIQRAAIAGLSLAEAEETIAQKMNEMKKRSQEAKEQVKVKVAAAQATVKASSNANSNADSRTASPLAQEVQQTPSAPMTCPGCGAGVSESDVFCGNCGNKLK